MRWLYERMCCEFQGMHYRQPGTYVHYPFLETDCRFAMPAIFHVLSIYYSLSTMQNCECGGFTNECAVNFRGCTTDNLEPMCTTPSSKPIADSQCPQFFTFYRYITRCQR